MGHDPSVTNLEIVSEGLSFGLRLQCHGIDSHGRSQERLRAACKASAVQLCGIQKAQADRESCRSCEVDWSKRTLGELMQHLVMTHHQYLARAMPELAQMTARVVEMHGDEHPELFRVQEVYGTLQRELNTHMRKEERILFPAIQRLEHHLPAAETAQSILGPVRVMLYQHETTRLALEELHTLTHGYYVPEHSCMTFAATMSALAELERDLLEHMHKENDILFPRAIGSDEAYASLQGK